MIKSVKFMEKIFLDTHDNVHVAFSVRGCGILVQATVGKHDGDNLENRRTALEFAYQVVHAIGLSPAHERNPTPKILVDAADAVITDPEHVFLTCTTWQCLPEGMVEISSVGSNSVLLLEKNTVQKVIPPHNINELLKSQGIQGQNIVRGGIFTHALGSRKNHKGCSPDDVRVSFIPLLSTTTIAIIADWRLAEDIIRQAIPRNELSSFIDVWDLLAKKVRTSVVISL